MRRDPLHWVSARIGVIVAVFLIVLLLRLLGVV